MLHPLRPHPADHGLLLTTPAPVPDQLVTRHDQVVQRHAAEHDADQADVDQARPLVRSARGQRAGVRVAAREGVVRPLVAVAAGLGHVVLVDGRRGVHGAADRVRAVTVRARRHQSAAVLHRPAVIAVQITLHDPGGDAVLGDQFRVGVADSAQLAGQVFGRGRGIGIQDATRQVLVVAIVARGRVVDAERQRLAVDRGHVLDALLLVASAARPRQVDPVDACIWVLGVLQVMDAVAIDTCDGMVAVDIDLAVHRLLVLCQGDRQPHVIGRHHGFLAVTVAAHLRQIVRVDRRGRILHPQNVVPVVTVGAGCGALVAPQATEPVHAAAVRFLDIVVAGAATTLESADGVLGLVRAVAREAGHVAIGEQIGVDRARELVSLDGVALRAVLRHTLGHLRLVRSVDIVARRAVERRPVLPAQVHVATALDGIHGADMTRLAEHVDRTGGRRQARTVRLVAGDAARAVARGARRRRVHTAVVEPRLARVAGAAGLLGHGLLDAVQLVRITVGRVATHAVGRLPVAGVPRLVMEILAMARNGVGVARRAVHPLVAFEVRNILEIAGLVVAIDAIQTGVHAGLEDGQFVATEARPGVRMGNDRRAKNQARQQHSDGVSAG